MRVVRLAILLAALGIGAFTGASSAAVPAPTGLHGFLLVPSEQPTTTFHRTPSFAWSPVRGAEKYELQLSTSSAFRDNGILYDDSSLLTPVAAPSLTLPWTTGSPHSLYARVRALTPGGESAWSAPFGFDIVPPPAPAAMASADGLLRWEPVDGAEGYQVWLLDADKIETVNTNVLDEREYYAFHDSQSWIGTVRWRVRALRTNVSTSLNGIPISHYGPWSSVYTSTNPAPTDAPIHLLGTLSNVYSDGSSSSPAHELMPAFSWSGDEGLDGIPSHFFRVYVFTDKDCVNQVFAGAIVGSPAYAPRPGGPLAMPANAADIATAEDSFLGDGPETESFSFDGQPITPTEQQPAATPTTSLPGGSTTGTTGNTTSGTVTVSGSPGAPIDLWDVDWPSSGYYWTVVPVLAVGADATTVVDPGAQAGSTVVPVSSTAGFETGDQVTIGVAPNSDSGKVVAIGAGTITLDQPLAHDHAPGDPILRPIRYQDLELPQDACAAGRVQRFGISSAPSLTSWKAPFATGLSARGRLVSAAQTKIFYGEPLVAWMPAYGASVYEVQWSHKRYPFVAQKDPRTGTRGFMSLGTSAILPLRPGTWWYRVRGFDYNLPTGAQQMAWSPPAQLVVTAPKFRVTGR